MEKIMLMYAGHQNLQLNLLQLQKHWKKCKLIGPLILVTRANYITRDPKYVEWLKKEGRLRASTKPKEKNTGETLVSFTLFPVGELSHV
jgi:hypothetical protein